MTAQIVAAGLGVPLQAFIDVQYLDSKIMSQRPGMYLKYLPYLYDGVSGKLLTGGSYLFDTYENAKDYVRWASHEFEVGDPKVKFAEQPMFESFTGQVWKVIGAHSFAPIEAHAITRLQQWNCSNADAEARLRALYPDLRTAAEALGAASIWLLHHPDDNSVGMQLGFKKGGSADHVDATRTLETAREQTELSDMLSSNLDLTLSFDRTSVLLTLWLPKSRAAGGSELTIPYHPMVPDITHEHS